MEISTGMVLTCLGAFGTAVCLTGLLVTCILFPKQRKRLLETIDMEK